MVETIALGEVTIAGKNVRFAPVVLPDSRGFAPNGPANWGAGFLPSVYQGTWLKPKGQPIDNLQPPATLTASRQRALWMKSRMWITALSTVT